MLQSTYASNLSEQDHQIFAAVAAADHYLRHVLTLVDTERIVQR